MYTYTFKTKAEAQVFAQAVISLLRAKSDPGYAQVTPDSGSSKTLVLVRTLHLTRTKLKELRRSLNK